MRRVAQPVGLLGGVVEEEVVDDEEATAGDAGHLVHGRSDVAEVVRRDPCRDDVERAVGEGQVLGAADDVRAASRAPGRS